MEGYGERISPRALLQIMRLPLYLVLSLALPCTAFAGLMQSSRRFHLLHCQAKFLEFKASSLCVCVSLSIDVYRSLAN